MASNFSILLTRHSSDVILVIKAFNHARLFICGQRILQIYIAFKTWTLDQSEKKQGMVSVVAALTQPAITASHVDQLKAVQKNRLCDGLLVLARVWNDTFGKQQTDLILNPKQVRSSFDQLFAFPYFGLRIMLLFFALFTENFN